MRELLAKLKQTEEEGDTLLDRTMVFFSSNLGNASNHSTKNLPMLLAGGGFKHGQHLAFDPKNPRRSRTSTSACCSASASRRRSSPPARERSAGWSRAGKRGASPPRTVRLCRGKRSPPGDVGGPDPAWHLRAHPGVRLPTRFLSPGVWRALPQARDLTQP